MTYWAVAQTESSREKTAQRWLKYADYETYLPMVTERAPLFPAYLFVRIGRSGWSQVENTIGVVQLLRCDDRPSRIACEIVDALRGQERDGLVKLPEKKSPWRLGDQLRVAGGMFLDHIGLFDGMSAHERVYVLLDLFGRKTRTEIALADVVKLEIAKSAC